MKKNKSLPAAPTLRTPGSDSAWSEDGVDLTLIRWMLSLTPTERLEALQEHLWSVMRLRGNASET